MEKKINLIPITYMIDESFTFIIFLCFEFFMKFYILRNFCSQLCCHFSL